LANAQRNPQRRGEKKVPVFVYKGRRYNNPVELAFRFLGGKWKAPILWRLKDGPKRYGALKRSLGAISHKMLAQQLHELEKEHFVRRKVFGTVPPSVEYSLTERGKSSIPVIETLRTWGNTMRDGSASK
jgi:DNA-binding HxlR family transcriptional regulator